MTRNMTALLTFIFAALAAVPASAQADGPGPNEVELKAAEKGDGAPPPEPLGPPPPEVEKEKVEKKKKKEEVFEPQIAGESDGRIRMLIYDENDIYTVWTRVGYQSHIEFAQNEGVETISVGDRSFWQIIPSGNRLFIRPVQEDVATNMTVITNKRSYQFDLKSVADEDKKIVYVARFHYPDERSPGLARGSASTITRVGQIDPFLLNQPAVYNAPPPPPPAAYVPPPQAVQAYEPAPVALAPAPAPRPAPSYNGAPDMTSHETVPLSRRNYFYTYSGPEGAAPYEVFDDGQTTYFRYPNPGAPTPMVSVAEKDGRERALAVYRKGGYFAVDIVDSQIVLRSAGETVSIFNETLTPTP